MKKLGMKVVLGADTSQYRRSMKRSQGLVSAMQKQVKQLGGMIAGAFAVSAVINFAKTSAQAYNKQMQAETQLLTALKGRVSAQQELIKLAQQRQRVTLYGDEETIQAEALLAAFVKEEDQIKRIIPLVQDLATAKRMDLAAAADLVSKTLGSSTNALARYGIQVEGAVGSVERLESLMHGLNEAFGGQAEAAAKVGTASWQQLSNAFGDLKENIGSLSTEINGPVTQLTDFIYTVNDFLDSGGFKDFWKGLEDLPGWMKTGFKLTSPLGVIMQYNKAAMKVMGKIGNGGWEGGAGSTGMPYSSMTRRGMAPLPTVNAGQLAALQKYQQLIGRNMYAMSQAPMTTGPVTGAGVNTSMLADVTPALQKDFDTMKKIAYDNMLELGGIIQDGIMSAVDQVGYGLEQLISGRGNMQQFFDGLLSMFGRFVSKMGKMIMAYGIGMISFKKAFSNPYAAIAAGAALVAIGSAIAGAAQRGPAGMAGGGYGGAAIGYNVVTAQHSIQVQVEGKLRGEDIYYANKKQIVRMQRIGG